MYYLQSRYYDSGIGRFINADTKMFFQHNILMSNSFAYCNNNPFNHVDYSGEFPSLFLAGAALVAVIIIGVDHWLAAHQPKDGFVLETEISSKGIKKEGLYAKGNGFELNHNELTLCDMEAGLFRGTIESSNSKATLINAFSVSATASADWSGFPSVDVSAIASIYNGGIEFTLPLGMLQATITVDGYVGALGAGVELDLQSGKIRYTPPIVGVGGSYSVDIDIIE